MRPTEELRTEHRAIERMLAVLEEAARRLEEGQRPPADLFRRAVDFVRNFADRCHHGKEEQNLFPRLEAAGVPRAGGPLGVMLHEHDLGREHVGAIAGAVDAYEAGDASAASTIARHALAYVQLLRQHIDKEDNVLFPMADSVLSPQDQRELEAAFQRVEREVMGLGVHERYHRLLEELEGELGLASR